MSIDGKKYVIKESPSPFWGEGWGEGPRLFTTKPKKDRHKALSLHYQSTKRSNLRNPKVGP